MLQRRLSALKSGLDKFVHGSVTTRINPGKRPAGKVQTKTYGGLMGYNRK